MNLKKKAFMKPLATILSFVLLFVFVPIEQQAEAQASGSIIGMVLEGDLKTPVKGAIVKIYNTKTDESYSSMPTDEYGLYAINNVPVGEYSIVITTDEGDFIADMIVRVRAELPTPLTLSLKRDRRAALPGFAKKKPWYKKPIGMVIIVGAVVGTGFGIYKAVSSPETP